MRSFFGDEDDMRDYPTPDDEKDLEAYRLANGHFRTRARTEAEYQAGKRRKASHLLALTKALDMSDTDTAIILTTLLDPEHAALALAGDPSAVQRKRPKKVIDEDNRRRSERRARWDANRSAREQARSFEAAIAGEPEPLTERQVRALAYARAKARREGREEPTRESMFPVSDADIEARLSDALDWDSRQ